MNEKIWVENQALFKKQTGLTAKEHMAEYIAWFNLVVNHRNLLQIEQLVTLLTKKS